MKPRERKLVFILASIATTSVVVVGGYLAVKTYRQWEEDRWHYLSREEIESQEPTKTPPVLVLNGTVDGRDFEIVMRGFTNYFRKEAWGAPKGHRGFLGSQKPGGYAVEIRTGSFSGRWQESWQGSHRGGGGHGSEDYRDDLVPARDLWNSRGFIGPSTKYERHDYVLNHQSHFMRWEEEFEGWIQAGGIRIPKKSIWRETGRDYSSKWSRASRKFMIRTFKFQEEPSAEWFESRIKEYFPSSAISRRTNVEPKGATEPR